MEETPSARNKDWHIYRGYEENKDENPLDRLPEPPPWRLYKNRSLRDTFSITEREIELVNAALYLRRPLLITGPPGTGKSSLAIDIARQLNLGEVIKWAINSRSSVQESLYKYDAIERLRQQNQLATTDKIQNNLVDFLRLGELGTAFADSKLRRPRVLLIDEIDKSDIDLPNDLLHILEDGVFEIPELIRMNLGDDVLIRHHKGKGQCSISKGRVECEDFPFVIITSNGERDLPGPFLRRCISLNIMPPDVERLIKITSNHLERLDSEQKAKVRQLAQEIFDRREKDGEYVATDQLLNAAFLEQAGFDLGSAIEKSDFDTVTLKEYILKAIGRIKS